jgi:hypothetical protein
MHIFFALMIMVGVVLAWNKNNYVWFEGILSNWRGVGVLLIGTGIVGLVCLWVSPGRAQEHHPQAIHEKFYSTWFMPDAPQTSCCSNHDCSPAASRFVGDRWEAQRHDGTWVVVPPGKVEQNRDSPDGRSHLCGRPGPIGEFYVFCFIRGSGT